MKKILVIILFTFSMGGCETVSDIHNESDYFVFGTFYGECAGNKCVQIYKLMSESLFMEITHRYPGDGSYNGIYKKLSEDKYNIAKHLLEQIPDELYQENKTILGAPDALDQGGVYIETRKNEIIQSWRIDTDNRRNPSYIHNLVDSIISVVRQLRD